VTSRDSHDRALSVKIGEFGLTAKTSASPIGPNVDEGRSKWRPSGIYEIRVG